MKRLVASCLLLLGGIPANAAPEAGTGLQHQLAVAVPDDVIDVTSIAAAPTPPNWPAFPTTKAFTGGVTMVYDGSPERVPGPGITYADTLPVGPARIMLYHVNATTDAGNTPQPLKFSVVLEPVDAAHPSTVTIRRKTVHGWQEGYWGIGVACAYDYFSQQESSIGIPVGGPTLLDADLETHDTPPSTSLPLVEGIYEFDVSDNPVRFTCVALPPDSDTLSSYAALSPLTRETWSPGVYKHDRGTFLADGNKTISNSIPYDTALGSGHIRIASGVSDSYGPDAFAGEGTPAGVDALSSPPIASRLKGNFGVAYTFNLKVASTDGRRVAILVNPRGGAIAGAYYLGDSLTGSGMFYCPRWPISPPTSPSTSPLYGALIGRWDPARTPNITFKWHPAGATSTPVEFLVIPYAEPGDVNADGRVDLLDTVLAVRYATGLVTPSARQRTAADVDPYDIPNGTVTVADAAWILRKAAGLR